MIWNMFEEPKTIYFFWTYFYKKATATWTCGVPQGSILRPLLFLLCVNDLHHASMELNPIMFADDTNLSSHTVTLTLCLKQWIIEEMTNVSN